MPKEKDFADVKKYSENNICDPEIPKLQSASPTVADANPVRIPPLQSVVYESAAELNKKWKPKNEEESDIRQEVTGGASPLKYLLSNSHSIDSTTGSKLLAAAAPKSISSVADMETTALQHPSGTKSGNELRTRPPPVQRSIILSSKRSEHEREKGVIVDPTPSRAAKLMVIPTREEPVIDNVYAVTATS